MKRPLTHRSLTHKPLTQRPPTAIGLGVILLFAGMTANADEPEVQSQEIPGSKHPIYWVSIPVGSEGYPETITIGSPATEKGRSADEGPTWTVKVSPFSIMKHELTWDIYDLFRQEYAILQDTRISGDQADQPEWADAVSIPTPLWEQDSRPILEGLGTSGGYPVADVTQFAAMQFSKWLSKKTGQFLRLPTEAEWEYAARGPNGRTYPWGEARPNASRARFGGQERKALKIGSLPQGATLEGVHDLAGNVAEWVQDWWHPSYYAESPPADPQGPADGDYRVARGGSWNQPPDELRSSARLYHNPDKGAGHIGFRCAQSAGF